MGLIDDETANVEYSSESAEEVSSTSQFSIVPSRYFVMKKKIIQVQFHLNDMIYLL